MQNITYIQIFEETGASSASSSVPRTMHPLHSVAYASRCRAAGFALAWLTQIGSSPAWSLTWREYVCVGRRRCPSTSPALVFRNLSRAAHGRAANPRPASLLYC